MSETEKVARPKAEVADVTMTDGRVVGFAGKRKVVKDTIIDDSKITVDGSTLMIADGAVAVRMDFRNGETRTMPIPLSLLAKFAGHGGEQKFGDELATTADKPLSEEDMVVAIDDLYAVISGGNWGRGRACEGGGGVSGASIVLQAICEATGKDLATVKAYIQKKLDADKDLTRRALYDSFRVATTKTGQIIKRLEEAKLAKTAKVDADAELAGI
jgi:hypothetical protein